MCIVWVVRKVWVASFALFFFWRDWRSGMFVFAARLLDGGEWDTGDTDGGKICVG